MQRKKRSIPTFLTPEEIDRLFAAIKATPHSTRDMAIFRLAYHRGLRASELGIIQLCDYREKPNKLQVQRLKGSYSGEFGLTQVEGQCLRNWLRERGRDSGPMFTTRNHHPISRSRLDQLMKQYCAAADIPAHKAHMHALKHSCGTRLSEKDTDIVAIKDWLGHVNIQNTMIYVQVTSKRRDEFSAKHADWR